MKLLVLLIASVVSSAGPNCDSPRNTDNTQHIIDITVETLLGIEKKEPNDWEKIFPVKFLLENRDLDICPTGLENIRKTNANAKLSKYILIGGKEVENKVTGEKVVVGGKEVGYNLKLSFVGNSPQKKKSKNIVKRVYNKAKELVKKPKSNNRTYDVLVITDRDQASLDAIQMQYPKLIIPEGLKYINHDNNKEPIILIHPTGDENAEALFLTGYDSSKLEFSTMTPELPLLPKNLVITFLNGCPE